MLKLNLFEYLVGRTVVTEFGKALIAKTAAAVIEIEDTLTVLHENDSEKEISSASDICGATDSVETGLTGLTGLPRVIAIAHAGAGTK